MTSFLPGLTRDWGRNMGFPFGSPPSMNKSITGAKNLRFYVTAATLPEMKLGPGAPLMPPEGHRAHRNELSVRPEHWRKLDSMIPVEGDVIDSAIINFMGKNIPSCNLDVQEPDRVTGEGLTIPCEWFYVPEKILGQPSDLNRVVQWVSEYPLATAQRIMHLTFPHTVDWCFTAPLPDVDDDLVKSITWDHVRGGITVKSAVAVIIQPPWILSPADLESFVQCSELPVLDEASDPTSPGNEFKNGSQRLWAKVWDICSRRKCHFWVVTTFWGWVFGSFSVGRTHARVCSVRSFSSTEPTVLEHLLYWIGISMGVEGHKGISMGAERINDIVRADSNVVPAQPFSRIVPPPRSESESSWSAASAARQVTTYGDDGNSEVSDEDETEQAEVLELLIPPVGDAADIVPPIPIQNTLQLLQQNIVMWQQQLGGQDELNMNYHLHTIPGSPFATHSVASSRRTVSSSTSTVRDLGGINNGSWLSNRPEVIME